MTHLERYALKMDDKRYGHTYGMVWGRHLGIGKIRNADLKLAVARLHRVVVALRVRARRRI